MSLACRIFGHNLTGWAPSLYEPGEVRGCVRCALREYRAAPPKGRDA